MKTVKIASAVIFIGLWSTAFVMYFAWADRDTPIPDEATAIKAGCAAIQDHISQATCTGLVAHLEGNVWHVSNTLPEGYSGGGPNVELSKTDGRILNFYVTQ
jgi:hypothetical protein